MPSRRQIRESVVQFLYCTDLEGGAPAANMRDTFWNLITESDRRRLLTNTFKALEHLNMGHANHLVELTKRAQLLFPRLSATSDTLPLRHDLEQILAKESTWSVCFDRLKKIPFNDQTDEGVVASLESLLADLFGIERDLTLARKHFLAALEDHPSIRNFSEPVAAVLRRMQRISERNAMLENPEKFPEQTDLAHLRGAKETLLQLRESADQMADQVLKQKKQIDTLLASVIENFAPERIIPVDRAILRLCASEFLSNNATNTSIVINEAIDLAKKYGSEDSGRFVNGVLDALSRKIQAENSPA